MLLYPGVDTVVYRELYVIIPWGRYCSIHPQAYLLAVYGDDTIV